MRKIFTALMILAVCCSCACGEISKETVESAFKRIAEADGFKEMPINYEDNEAPNAWVAFKSKDDYTLHVTKGLMKVLNTEDEIAGVWGHEIGHVRLGHYTKGMWRNIGWAVAGKILEKKTGKLTQAAGNIGMNLAENGFSRRQETQSDEYGVKLLVKAGYDPMGLYSAIKAFKDSGYVSQPGIANWFETHPATDKRLKRLNEFADKYRK